MADVRPQLPVIDFEQVGPKLGERFPDIELPDQWGNPLNLHDHRDGRRGLVVFHRSASW